MASFIKYVTILYRKNLAVTNVMCTFITQAPGK